MKDFQSKELQQLFVNGYGNKGTRFYNNMAIACGVGFYSAGSAVYDASYNNNLAFGCTTNWGQAPATTSLEGAQRNAGISTDTPWGTNTITSMVQADFANFAGKNFRPAALTSHQVDAANLIFEGEPKDISGDIRPNYSAGTATADNWDIGCYEFNSGNGLAPLTVSISVSNIISGTVLAIYKSSDKSQIVAPITVSGTSFLTTYTYTVDTAVFVRLRKSSGSPKYIPQDLAGTITATGLTLTAMQILDSIA
jgi:hypothetical protein